MDSPFVFRKRMDFVDDEPFHLLEVADELFQNGIALAGQLAGVKGVDRFFTQELKIETYIVEHFEDATILGLMKLGKDKESLYKLISG